MKFLNKKLIFKRVHLFQKFQLKYLILICEQNSVFVYISILQTISYSKVKNLEAQTKYVFLKLHLICVIFVNRDIAY